MVEPVDEEPLPVLDCAEVPFDVEFVDAVEPVVLEEVLEVSSPSTFTSG